MLAFFEGDNEEYLNGLREAAKEYRGQVCGEGGREGGREGQGEGER